MKRFDLAVIGTGQGGVPLALDQAKAGKSVVLFERDKLGGTCVNVGCTPSKSFLASAHAAGRARRAGPLGVHADVRVDFPAVMERVRGIVHEWNAGVEDKIAKSTVTLVRAEASFIDARVLEAGGESYECETIAINTGTSPVVPPIPGLHEAPYRTNRDIFDVTSLPATLVVIGGGYIGLELGQGFARCGSRVHVIDQAARVLAAEEPDVSAILARRFEADGMLLHLDAKVAGVARSARGATVTLGDGTAIDADLVLVATGRRANVPAGALERAGVKLDERGYIAVDAHLRTGAAGVYAFGDAAGQPQFTHVSWEDFRRVKATIEGTEDRRRNDRVLGYAIYTDPQVGRVGLTAPAARAAGHAVREVTLTFDNLAHAIEFGETDGFFRLVVDAHDDSILGATFVGEVAGELIHVILAHMEARSTWRTLERSVHVHPTYAEGLPTLARMLV